MRNNNNRGAPTEIPQTGFFGHPSGLGILFSVEFWERFSYYGMRALLIFYMYYAIEDGGLGLEQTTAQSILSIYGSLIFMTSILGGWIADRILGTRSATFLGGVLIIIGHIFLSLPIGGLVALCISMFFIIIGSGLMKPNISNIVGRLYPKGDSRMDSGFVIFYMAVNMGALIAPIALTHFEKTKNFHGGFLIAAIGMGLALVIYLLFTRNTLGQVGLKPEDPLSHKEKKLYGKIFGFSTLALVIAAIIGLMTQTLTFDLISYIVLVLGLVLPIVYFTIMIRSKEVSDTERSRVYAFIPLFVVGVIFWSIQEQGANVLNVFAKKSADLSLNLFGLEFDFPLTWFQTINPFFIVVFAPIISFLWKKLDKYEPSLPMKFAIGLMFAGASFILMMVVIMMTGSAKIAVFWIILSYMICVIGELLISPTGSSSAVKLAPLKFNAQMMSLWLLTNATAQALNGQLVKLIPILGDRNYFGFIGGFAVLIGIVIFLITPIIKRSMKGIH
ncbi:peptide MFS transporter [Staphylococcus massiliensis]|uniref:Di-tripeptide ABC transporter n=1 Tax=Staphylococcus massiliensis S46 TaxID=1229783 RepID=K9B431_9STAP|nr:peptide MFS transporter [Staphylococcus massiliensis]EKU48540.1 di-tripeptide ABC transporter [Staphylococcus massiliensis S46]MCG3400093.1 peptide MFS transporter [Staphylococcus massiliensis]MCG3412688.1 peptide MFS transporter [Staphylococcus massiliensis]POA01549.1 peptide MFS transporter [Staphylococcus massiliensis CCUG 55927]